MPLKARARSANAVRRDAEILDAAVDELVDAGIDGLGMLAVARRCGLAAGSVYSRHETVGELLVEVWEQRSRPDTTEFLSILASVVSGEAVDLDDLIARILTPSKSLLVGIQCLAQSRRVPELQEVIRPAFDHVMKWDTHSPVERARIAYLAGYALGAVVRHQITPIPRSVLEFSLDAMSRAVTSTVPNLAPDWNPPLGGIVRAHSDSDLRNALIESAMSVIGQVGLVNTTVSRIGRRAGLTAGAVYTAYETKDDLLIDAVRTLLGEAISANRELTDQAADRLRMADASAALLVRAAGPVRRPWLLFRLEAYMAALYRRDLAAVLDELHTENLARYHSLISSTGAPEPLILAVAVAGQSIPLGLSILDEWLDGLELLDYRHVTEPLFGRITGTVEQF